MALQGDLRVVYACPTADERTSTKVASFPAVPELRIRMEAEIETGFGSGGMGGC
jgi:hypothetical protein